MTGYLAYLAERLGTGKIYRRECKGAHKTGPIIWAGTAHQGVICEVCGRFLHC